MLPAERERWNAYRRSRLQVDSGLSEVTFAQFDEQIAALRSAHANDGDRQVLLDRLQAWGRGIEASLG